MNFGSKIAEYRKNLGWTQEMLADQCSVTRQAVAKWEKGESMPDIYTIERLANLFSVSIEELIHTGDAVTESQSFYIRRLKEGDEDALCRLMRQHGVLGRLFEVLNDYNEDDGTPTGDQKILDFYYPNAQHIYLIFSRAEDYALGIFDVNELAEKKPEMSAFIESEPELEMSLFKDFFIWLRKEYGAKAATISVWGGQEEKLLASLGYTPADGICAIAIPLG